MAGPMLYSAPWGKLDRNTGARHHLAHHCADVAAAFLAWAALPTIQARMGRAVGGPLRVVDLERLAVLVFLHDIGKLFPSFQCKGWPESTWNGNRTGHVLEACDVLNCLPDPGVASALHVGRIAEWVGDSGLFDAILAHHGRPPELRGERRDQAANNWRTTDVYDPTAAALHIGALLPHWFPQAFSAPDAPLPSSPVFEHLFAGMTALADWVGSSRPVNRYIPGLDCDYMAIARRDAAEQIATYGLDPSVQRGKVRVAPTFDIVSGRSTPNGQQALVGMTDLDAQLVILEAETGSGKTEAALWRYAQLFAAGRVDGLYFAVPTRSAAVQLHGRVAKSVQRLFGDADPQAVLAVPGYLRAGDTSGTPLPHWQVRWDDDGGADELRLQARWAAEDSKKYLAAQVAIGTVDQAMLGALLIKHAHVRAASLSRSLVVLDEVHASDRYMTAIQKRLIDQHLRVGGYAMLMSATLGSIARSRWLGRPMPTLSDAVAAAYPAVWTDRQIEPRTLADAPGRSKTVTMTVVPTMAADVTARHALEAARQGARVLVIRNTVTRAIETLAALEQQASADRHLLFAVAGQTTLHHSRFAPTDRKLLDAAVEKALETTPQRAPGGIIIVGTQTLEQSLDVCADHLITDLCPVDVLLQRIGRLHRHSLPRPKGFARPQCKVLVPERGLEPLLTSFDNGLGCWRAKDGTLSGVYMDVSVLELTRRLIEAHPAWSIPAMNRMLVENATHPEAIRQLHTELGQAWTAFEDRTYAAELARMQAANYVLLDHRLPFANLKFPGGEERIRTRLGGEGARLTFAKPQPGPFGEAVAEVVLPAHWPAHISVDEVPSCSIGAEGQLEIETSKDQYAYDRYGLRRRVFS